MSPPRSPSQSKHPLVPGALRLAPITIPAAAVLAGLITLALIIASDDCRPRQYTGARRHVIARDWLRLVTAYGPTSGPRRQVQICRCLPSFPAAPVHRAMTRYRPFNIVTT